jgi:hypothetical protein
MSSLKIYYPETDVKFKSAAMIHRNTDGELYICLINTEDNTDEKFTSLTEADAKEIITQLARDFDMLDETTAEGHTFFTF